MMVLPGEDFNRWRRISAFHPANRRYRKAKAPAGRQGPFSPQEHFWID